MKDPRTPEPRQRRDESQTTNGADRRKKDGQLDPRLAVAMGLAAAAIGAAAGTTMKADTEKLPRPKGIASSVQSALKGDAESPIPLAWDLPDDRNDQVDFFIEYLVREKSAEMREWLARAGTYGPYIRAELRARGMPEDLFYLAMIESGLNPDAYSVAHAAGIWQFIKETGQRYGLEVSRYVDERRDPLRATPAALDYLQELHERFGSWFLAAASYNTGENRVGRIMREEFGSERGSDENYWKIGTRLPRETRDYVPLMLAAAHISKHAGDYGLGDVAFDRPLAFEEVELPGGTDLADVAAAAGVAEADVKALNPHLIRGMTPPDRSYTVRVPEGTAPSVALNFRPDSELG